MSFECGRKAKPKKEDIRWFRMGNCSECGKKIENNRFRKIGGDVLCLECYRAFRRGEPTKEELNMSVEEAKEVVYKMEALKDGETKKPRRTKSRQKVKEESSAMDEPVAEPSD